MKESVRKSVQQFLTKYLETNRQRKTPERFAILDAICDVEGHFTLDELGQKLETDYNFPVSRATLYNTMRLFLELHIVERHHFEGITSYEISFDSNRHCHRICTICGEVKEFKLPPEVINSIANLHLGRFKQEGFSLYIYGICQSCQIKMAHHNRKLNHKNIQKDEQR
jgi:Fur family ferric uptake transcriptional regulator